MLFRSGNLEEDDEDVDEASVAQKDAFVVTGGKGDNDQKIIGVFKDEKSAKKARDDYNKKNRPAKKSHFARIYKQTRLSQAGKRFKPGEKIGYMTYSNKAQFIINQRIEKETGKNSLTLIKETLVEETDKKVQKNSFEEDLRKLVETRIRMTRQKLDNQNLQKLLKKRIEVTRLKLNLNNITQ